jgi:hypothetical protein
MEEINAVLNFLAFFPQQYPIYYLILKGFFLLLCFGLALALFWFLAKTSYLKFHYFEDLAEFLTYRTLAAAKIPRTWRKIQKRMESPLESEHKLAIVEADSLLDEVLAKLGYPGTNLKERLDQLEKIQFANLEALREAHQLRDNIVHDPDFKLDPERARKTMGVFEEALRNLQAL